MIRKYKKGSVIKSKEDIELEFEGNYYNNPPVEILLKAGWIEIAYDEYTGKIISNLNFTKKNALRRLSQYDKSPEVNSFYVGDIQAWIDRDTRVSLMNSTQILKNSGQDTTTLWLNGQSFTIPCDSLIQMLGVLEVYALQCYNVTEQHKANINALESITDVQNYNFKSGYPEKLVFSVQ